MRRPRRDDSNLLGDGWPFLHHREGVAVDDATLVSSRRSRIDFGALLAVER
jgi:hypothetical protein